MEKHITFDVEEHMTGQTVEKVLRTALGLTKRPVSYTHLDVYKRQIQIRYTWFAMTAVCTLSSVGVKRCTGNH